MRPRGFLWRTAVALVLVFAVASGLTNYLKVYRWHTYTPLVDAFLIAAAQRDTATLRQLAIDSRTVAQTLSTSSQTLDQLHQEMRIRWGARRADTVIVDYATRGASCYQVRLLLVERAWRVAWLRREPC